MGLEGLMSRCFIVLLLGNNNMALSCPHMGYFVSYADFKRRYPKYSFRQTRAAQALGNLSFKPPLVPQGMKVVIDDGEYIVEPDVGTIYITPDPTKGLYAGPVKVPGQVEDMEPDEPIEPIVFPKFPPPPVRNTGWEHAPE